MATAAVPQSEKEFTSNYLTLLSLSSTPYKYPLDYKKDIREIKGLGVKLPNLPVQKKKSSSSSTVVRQCIFKSIKPPKFNVTLSASSTDTVYQVKSELAKHADLTNVEPSQIKLLLKGKVIQDASLLSDIADSGEEIKFTVIVSAPIAQASEELTQSATPLPVQRIELPWAEIKALLASKGVDSAAAIARLQHGWELTE